MIFTDDFETKWPACGYMPSDGKDSFGTIEFDSTPIIQFPVINRDTGKPDVYEQRLYRIYVCPI